MTALAIISLIVTIIAEPKDTSVLYQVGFDIILHLPTGGGRRATVVDLPTTNKPTLMTRLHNISEGQQALLRCLIAVAASGLLSGAQTA